jgi:hypothetical protein
MAVLSALLPGDPVPAAMTGQARSVSRQAGKSDPIDAWAVALDVARLLSPRGCGSPNGC